MLFSKNRSSLVSVALIACLMFCTATIIKADDNDSDLCDSFTALREIVSPAKVKSIIFGSHSFDFGLWKAVFFLKTQEFKQIGEKIESSVPYQNILERFEEFGLNADVMTNCLKMHVQEYVEIPQARSFSSTAQQVVNSISHKTLYNTVRKEIANNHEFEIFYHILSDAGFQAQVRQALNSPALSGPIHQLSQHGIDLQQLVTLAFKVISWGPKV